MKKPIEDLVRQNIKDLKAYSSARNEFIGTANVFLDANENPYGNGLNRYPDALQTQLKQNLSAKIQVETEKIILGNGSDEILDLVFRTFCNPGLDNIIITPPTYGMYKVIANINDIHIREAPLTPQFELDIDMILKQVDQNTKMIVLCSPNNPSGNSLNAVVIEQLLKQLDCIVLIDEAYIEFSTESSWCTRLDEFPNLVVSRTLSKAWGLAGIRLGIGIASSYIISILNKVKPPYNVNALTEQKAIDTLQRVDIFNANMTLIKSERTALVESLQKFSFIEKIYPSDANFLLIKVGDADGIYNFLRENGVIIRNRSTQPGCANTLRITVGTPEENRQLINVLNNMEK